jgi:hypothetical protein
VSTFNDVTALAQATGPTYEGFAPTGAACPYIVHRPLVIDTGSVAVNGAAISWDSSYTLYCCGDSVEASFNLAVALMSRLQGARVAGTTLNTSMGYSGAPVEGHYETQVTAQLNVGGI